MRNLDLALWNGLGCKNRNRQRKDIYAQAIGYSDWLECLFVIKSKRGVYADVISEIAAEEK